MASGRRWPKKGGDGAERRVKYKGKKKAKWRKKGKKKKHEPKENDK